MCGIMGVASNLPITERGWLAAGMEAMRHRGPDASGEWWSGDGRVGLGHRRLAIVDLTAAGSQPMGDADRRFIITFNGEIYNHCELRNELSGLGHKFGSASDTEVILVAFRQWGERCLDRLNGMFSFAIYDTQCRKLFLARDRAGEKPLFYSIVGKQLAFASELKALMCNPSFPRKLNRAALDCYLSLGYVPGGSCILEGVLKLPPSHALSFSVESGMFRSWCYWSVPAYSGAQVVTSSYRRQLVDELETLLQDSVGRQMLADVPVGILLSGGVDSSLVTAMAARTTSRLKTFTIRFPGFGKLDETKHARLIANHFGTVHTELVASDATVDLLPSLARQYDEPIVDSSMIPTFLVSKLTREHCTVAIGGDGGDELFGGYAHYSRMLLVKRYAQLLPNSVLSGLSDLARSVLPIGFKGRNWIQSLAVDFKHDLPTINPNFDVERRTLMTSLYPWQIVAEDIRRSRVPEDNDLIRRATIMDFQNYLPEDILVKVDRASMLSSLEVRAPLLDFRLIEFAYSRVPSVLKATPRKRKVLLKDLAMRVLPPEFDRTRKQGFAIPLGAWLQSGPWRDMFEEVLLSSENILFDKKAVADLLRGQSRGRTNSERLFALVLFELWRREYKVAL